MPLMMMMMVPNDNMYEHIKWSIDYIGLCGNSRVFGIFCLEYEIFMPRVVKLMCA